MTAPRHSGITGMPVHNEMRHEMTNSFAIIFGLCLIAALTLDYALFGSEHLLFLAKKFFALLDWVAFWR